MKTNDNTQKTSFLNMNDRVITKGTPEFTRKIFAIKLFAMIGILFTLPFGILSLYHGHHILATSLLFISILLGINYLLMIKTHNDKMGSALIVYVFLGLFLYLVYSGGVSSTGALWIYAFPALALFLHGLKQGLIDITIFVVLLIFMFLFMDGSLLEVKYADEYKLRLIISFLVVTFLTSLYEYSNSKYMIEMNNLTQKLINVAKADQLTELKNRRGMYEEMESLYTEAKENNEPLCLMLCDIDYLKDIKNRYGQKVRDMVIQEIAKEIQNSIKNMDCLSRWSGEEFLILLPNTELKNAQKFSLALSQRIKNLRIIHDQKQIQVSLSIGISDIENVKSIYAAVRHADNAMYQSKQEMASLV